MKIAQARRFRSDANRSWHESTVGSRSRLRAVDSCARCFGKQSQCAWRSTKSKGFSIAVGIGENSLNNFCENQPGTSALVNRLDS